MNDDHVVDESQCQGVQAGRDSYAAGRDLTVNIYSSADSERGQIKQVCPVGPLVHVVASEVHAIAEFLGRDDELRALHTAFDRTAAPITTQAEQVSSLKIRVLAGVGGIGKTSLARAYANRFKSAYGVVWWINASDIEAAQSDFSRLLEILGPRDIKSASDPIAAVHAALANTATPWLLVLDNVEMPELMLKLVPATGIGDVLITSRVARALWPTSIIVTEINSLTNLDGALLLMLLSGDPDMAAAANLADKLGGLPLALAQAGSYVKHNGLTISRYIDLYERRRPEMHQQGHLLDYDKTVATTWLLASDNLPPEAQTLMKLLCWYAPDAIPVDLLLNATSDQAKDVAPYGAQVLPEQASRELHLLMDDELVRNRAIVALMNYSLVAMRPSRVISVHRLVQAVTIDQVARHGLEAPWIDAAASFLAEAALRMPESLESLNLLRPHLAAVLDKIDPDQSSALQLRAALAELTAGAGMGKSTVDMYLKLTGDHLRVHGNDNLATLQSRYRLAYWVGQMGYCRSARDLTAGLLGDVSRLYGHDHPATKNVRSMLDHWAERASVHGDFLERNQYNYRQVPCG